MVDPTALPSHKRCWLVRRVCLNTISNTGGSSPRLASNPSPQKSEYCLRGQHTINFAVCPAQSAQVRREADYGHNRTQSRPRPRQRHLARHSTSIQPLCLWDHSSCINVSYCGWDEGTRLLRRHAVVKEAFTLGLPAPFSVELGVWRDADRQRLYLHELLRCR